MVGLVGLVGLAGLAEGFLVGFGVVLRLFVGLLGLVVGVPVRGFTEVLVLLKVVAVVEAVVVVVHRFLVIFSNFKVLVIFPPQPYFL